MTGKLNADRDTLPVDVDCVKLREWQEIGLRRFGDFLFFDVRLGGLWMNDFFGLYLGVFIPKTTTMKKEKFAPIDRARAKRYVKTWLEDKPTGTTCYVELPVADIQSLISRNNLTEDNGAIRIYFGINDENRQTIILVAALSSFVGTTEHYNDPNTFGENFGTLCPPYNLATDPTSLASEAISELLMQTDPVENTTTNVGKRKKKK